MHGKNWYIAYSVAVLRLDLEYVSVQQACTSQIDISLTVGVLFTNLVLAWWKIYSNFCWNMASTIWKILETFLEKSIQKSVDRIDAKLLRLSEVVRILTYTGATREHSEDAHYRSLSSG